MGTLAQEFAFVSEDVHDFARRYVTWAEDYSREVIGRFGRDWRETAPVDVRDIGRAARHVRDNASAVKRDILEAATRAGCVKTDAEIQATCDQTERDFYKRDKRRVGRMILTDFNPDLTPDPRTDSRLGGVTILDTLCEDTAHVDSTAVKHSVALVRDVLAKVNAKAAEAFDAIGKVDWDAARSRPNLVQFARALGVTRNPARKRWQSLDRLLRSEEFAAMLV